MDARIARVASDDKVYELPRYNFYDKYTVGSENMRIATYYM